jgi:hypothetical protein
MWSGLCHVSNYFTHCFDCFFLYEAAVWFNSFHWNVSSFLAELVKKYVCFWSECKLSEQLMKGRIADALLKYTADTLVCLSWKTLYITLTKTLHVQDVQKIPPLCFVVLLCRHWCELHIFSRHQVGVEHAWIKSWLY